MSKDINFTKALSRLEEIVSKLESQELDLEESVQLLAEGLALHKKCQDKLGVAQDKIDKLLSVKGGDLK
ncbi:MAG: hypothetical protein ACD_57C00190G0003 [uncultured bacterium]|uniref:Exodeoxyribonuclease 7 small subunit n=1 Tax=Candidatus Curtissbacteria bacterium RIFOXYA1_FULL_41_14 TaxID=1797737 RepID=A0A1F5HBG9_9BACT|nr:MAG: hypothetical protein ACD_57C00190G0003 [uncultured bacterium]KKR58014.1 MAG: Exodeoxyribonuclease 7 small subunit [Candidatus Curtissbacteria bacterium GW2011_GWB1_40_28]KKR60964.1 MAG: Exodeoxyribonuclease 7 small subunit [Candidatus Curtissbacteria bacterium GW2011_GWA2_40_31]KKR61816.1 MAG: Exodeoxyribonuclease 7 small subunit [Microgenomates group bacterium GW2011_GWC1_40_35]KKR65866.1 MAG: Exodeoxyribonuclease 7 small subunit [Candidatus Curtissbacteria bacterium GW2011_GWA1_40_47]